MPIGLETGVDLLSIRLVAQSFPAVKLSGFSSLSEPLDFCEAVLEGTLLLTEGVEPSCCFIACSRRACSICVSSLFWFELAEPPEAPFGELEKRFAVAFDAEFDGIELPSKASPCVGPPAAPLGGLASEGFSDQLLDPAESAREFKSLGCGAACIDAWLGGTLVLKPSDDLVLGRDGSRVASPSRDEA